MLAPLSGMAPGFVNQLERIVCESGYIFDFVSDCEVFRSESIDLLARKFLAPNYIRFYLSFSISIQHCCCILPDDLLSRTIDVRSRSNCAGCSTIPSGEFARIELKICRSGKEEKAKGEFTNRDHIKIDRIVDRRIDRQFDRLW